MNLYALICLYCLLLNLPSVKQPLGTSVCPPPPPPHPPDVLSSPFTFHASRGFHNTFKILE